MDKRDGSEAERGRRAPLVVVTGTGTGIGKTHVAAALTGAWARAAGAGARGGAETRVAGLKPIESGVAPGAALGADGEVLATWSTFHVKHLPPPYLLERAVSPHLAARLEARAVDLGVVRAWVERARALADAVVLELAGGLFSPLTDAETNAELARALAPDALLLVAPDRLGVLHEVIATDRAARAAGLALSGVVMVAPAIADGSTGSNAEELARFVSVPVLASVPRASVDELVSNGALAGVLRLLFPS